MHSMKHGLVVRRAIEAEQPALEALQWRASLANPEDRDVLLANPDAIALPLEQISHGHVIVAERAGAMVGFAVVLPREDEGAELDGLFVEPGQWKQGIGRLLVDQCVAIACERGAAFLHVIGNTRAAGFYRACGFELVGDASTRFGPALSLRRRLSTR
jgi:GNAT superfamily N-acetyltransferase